MIFRKPHRWTVSLLLPLLLLGGGLPIQAQDGSRWFTIEVSIFSNENPADRLEELWSTQHQQLEYADNVERLRHVLDFLYSESLAPNAGSETTISSEEPLSELQIREQLLRNTGPFQAADNPLPDAIRIPDLDREHLLQLPPDVSDFQQTNRALERSPDHRLLFHGLWRQPVLAADQARPIYVKGGLQYGEQYELNGQITIRFNDNADRVVVDADLWLAEFSLVESTADIEWQLPEPPASALDPWDMAAEETGLEYFIQRIYQLRQSRAMRSEEFHYLDHPALGVLIQVLPYEAPPLPLPELDSASNLPVIN